MPLIATLREKQCVVCGQRFRPNSARQKYCSERCRRGTKTCTQCGKEFLPSSNATGLYCSAACWYSAPGKKLFEERQCKKCDKTFSPGSATQRYCSTACAHLGRRKERAFTHCENCGTELKFKLSKRTIRFCSRRCALTGQSRSGISAAPLGTVSPGPNGYNLIKVGKDYPGAFKNGWMLEHRHIMEQTLGRHLHPFERVHHKQGFRSTNDSDNLELWVVWQKDPAGQRVSDLIDFIVRYYRKETEEALANA
jgi:hypothetical protein